MKRRLAVACLLLVACAPPCAAQDEKGKGKQESLTLRQMEEDERNRETLRRLKAEPGGESLPPALAASFEPAEPPEGEGAWVVQVVTRGGFAGGGRGDVTVHSDGRVTCSLPGVSVCAEQDAAGALARLSRLLAEAKPSKWRPAAAGACSDCYLTLLAVRRRGPDGSAKLYTVYWDDASVGGAPAEALRIHDAALALTVPAK